MDTLKLSSQKEKHTSEQKKAKEESDRAEWNKEK